MAVTVDASQSLSLWLFRPDGLRNPPNTTFLIYKPLLAHLKNFINFALIGGTNLQ
jgi:hypothetical protein